MKTYSSPYLFFSSMSNWLRMLVERQELYYLWFKGNFHSCSLTSFLTINAVNDPVMLLLMPVQVASVLLGTTAINISSFPSTACSALGLHLSLPSIPSSLLALVVTEAAQSLGSNLMEVLFIMKIPLLAYHIFSLLFLFSLIFAIRDISGSDTIRRRIQHKYQRYCRPN